VACADNGISSFNLLRRRWRDEAVFLYVFDLIELTGDDRLRDPLQQRKLGLRRLLAKAGPGLRLNQWIDGDEQDGATIFFHACHLGLEGIVSKRKDLPYRSGRSPDWLKFKNPKPPAVRREAEEDWGRLRTIVPAALHRRNKALRLSESWALSGTQDGCGSILRRSDGMPKDWLRSSAGVLAASEAVSLFSARRS
jgi:bifunctional non-homologous end joining protein LigD